MGQQRGSRVFVGVVLAVVAAIGITQPGASAESAGSSQVADGSLQPNVEEYPTVCPKPVDRSLGADLLPQDPCEPPDPCAYDSDGDGIGDCDDPCPNDPGNTCNQPTTPPTTQPPTTQPPTTQPPTTAPPTTQPPVAPTATPTAPAPTVGTQPGAQPGCQAGCTYVRHVDLQVTATRLKGAVDSAAQGCRADATVTVWRKKKGADRRLMVLTSKQTGAFRTARPARAGRYYVTVTSPEQPLCASARSSTVRVGRS